MQQITTFFYEAPAAAVFVTASILSLGYLGIRLFASGLVKHFKNFDKQ